MYTQTHVRTHLGLLPNPSVGYRRPLLQNVPPHTHPHRHVCSHMQTHVIAQSLQLEYMLEQDRQQQRHKNQEQWCLGNSVEQAHGHTNSHI